MNFKELEKKIKEIANEKQIHEQEIINGLMANLDLKYSPKNHDEEDVKIINEIKSKIIRTLYNCKNQKQIVNQATKYDELFNLDKVEMDLLNDAWNELEADGDVYSLTYEIGLTKQGIRKYR